MAASVALGCVIGLSLGALGGGGSILAVPALVYGVGETAHAATTTSLVAVGATALVGLVGHWRAGSVRFASGLIFGLVGLGGAALGSLLSRAVPNQVLLLAFSALILGAAWRMHCRYAETPCHIRQSIAPASRGDGERLVRRAGGAGSVSTSAPPDTPAARDRGRRERAATAGRVVAAGSVVGFLTGFFGVGGGFVIVPALVLALGYEMPVAVGTSLLVIAISSAEALIFRLHSGGVDWPVAVPFTAAGFLGVIVGDAMANRVPAARLTRWFVWLLVVVAGYTAAHSLLTMWRSTPTGG
ncbi:sulfite exporter TauE/SafE family protein [Mycobacterium sp. SM1]|nr:sulfite exporter TauE/SafE family protein [Mycobacterium sp. SM1]